MAVCAVCEGSGCFLHEVCPLCDGVDGWPDNEYALHQSQGLDGPVGVGKAAIPTKAKNNPVAKAKLSKAAKLSRKIVEVPMPELTVAKFKDPRLNVGCSDVPVVPFYFPDKETQWDERAQAGFLGNFWPCEISIQATDPKTLETRMHTFMNSEAAYQALKYWDQASEFIGLCGGESCYLAKTKRSGSEAIDPTYGGYGGSWQAMMACLKVKFELGSTMADCLLATEDSFLLEHNAVEGRDLHWSDNHIGNGLNWLGVQLMLIRDALRYGDQPPNTSWTRFFSECCRWELQSGWQPNEKAWLAVVQNATDQVLLVFPSEK